MASVLPVDGQGESEMVTNQEMEDQKYQKYSQLVSRSRTYETGPKPTSKTKSSELECMWPYEHDDQRAMMTHSLQERYSQLTDVKMADGIPNRYCYRSENEDTSPAEYHGVAIENWGPTADDVVKQNLKSVWMDLPPIHLDKLYILLNTPIKLCEVLTFDKSALRRTWQNAAYRIDTDEVISLSLYGTEDNTSMMTHLRRGRSNDELKKTLPNEIYYLMLIDLWHAALVNSMTNGMARTAVYGLLERLVVLLKGLSASFPLMSLTHVTPTSDESCFPINSSSSASSSTRSSSPSRKSSPPRKRKKIDSESGDESPLMSKQTNNKKCVDLTLASYDTVGGFAKYMLLVEIHPHGMNIETTSNKFCREMIHVLQSQNEVFGLLVSTEEARLYRATRNPSQEIFIYWQPYKFVKTSHLFDVQSFQKLIMDLFTCLFESIFIPV